MAVNYPIHDNSPTCDQRVYKTVHGARGATGLLLHTTVGTNSLSWLLGDSASAGNPASADYLIDRDGVRHQCCPLTAYPYHAGTSLLPGQGFGDGISRMYVGVELEALITEYPTFQQIDSLAELIIEELTPRYGWRWPFVIFGHYGVAIPVGRRSDPYLMDWGSLMGRLYARGLEAHTSGLVE